VPKRLLHQAGHHVRADISPFTNPIYMAASIRAGARSTVTAADACVTKRRVRRQPVHQKRSDHTVVLHLVTHRGRPLVHHNHMKITCVDPIFKVADVPFRRTINPRISRLPHTTRPTRLRIGKLHRFISMHNDGQVSALGLSISMVDDADQSRT